MFNASMEQWIVTKLYSFLFCGYSSHFIHLVLPAKPFSLYQNCVILEQSSSFYLRQERPKT